MPSELLEYFKKLRATHESSPASKLWLVLEEQGVISPELRQQLEDLESWPVMHLEREIMRTQLLVIEVLRKLSNEQRGKVDEGAGERDQGGGHGGSPGGQEVIT